MFQSRTSVFLLSQGHASSDYSDDGQVDSRETNCEQPMKSSMVTARTSPVEEQVTRCRPHSEVLKHS